MTTNRIQLAEPGDINVIGLEKKTEWYWFFYDDNQRAETLRTLGRYASNPELSFTWYDAALLGEKMTEMLAEAMLKKIKTGR